METEGKECKEMGMGSREKNAVKWEWEVWRKMQGSGNGE